MESRAKKNKDFKRQLKEHQFMKLTKFHVSTEVSAGTPDRDRRTSPTPNLSFVHNFPSFVLSLFDVRRSGGFFVLFHQKNQPAAGHFLLFRSIPPKKSACGGLFPPFSFYSTKNRLRRAIFLFSFYSSVDVSFFRAIRSF